MTGTVLRLVPAGPPLPDPALLDWLGAALHRALRFQPLLGAELEIAPDAPGRLSSNALVDALIELYPPAGDRLPAEWTLALTAADLFAPGRDFVFGEAALGGRWAVVSSARLGPPGPDAGEARLRTRLLKEAVHELGHLAGLDHCPRPRCAMAASPLPEDVDRKDARFCRPCAERFAGLDPPPPRR